MAALVNDRNELLYTASSRVTGAIVTITSGVVNTLVVPRNATVPVPSVIPLQANTVGYITPSYSWGYRFGTSGTFIPIINTTNTVNFNSDAAFLTAAGSSTLVQFKVSVAETTSNIGVNQTEYILSIPILREGANGVAGINSVSISIYKRSTTNTPLTFTSTDLIANSTYVFTSGLLVGAPAGWSQTIPPESEGSYLWVSQARAAGTGSEFTFANNLWTTPTLYTKDGATGTAGINSALVYAYRRSASDLTTNPGAAEYSFTNKAISTTTLANGWLKSFPSTGDDPVYVCIATAASNTATAAIAATDWSTPVKFSSNGINNATVYLYARNNNSTTPPAVATTGTTIYNFTNGAISGTPPSGWTATIPAESNGAVLWVIQATAVSNSATDNIANTEWNVARVLGQQGADGAPGTRGSRQLYSGSNTYTSTYAYLSNAAGAASYAAKATALIAEAVVGTAPTTPIKGDTVTFSNPTVGSEYVYTITHDGTNWVTPGTVIDGSLLVTNSITASKIKSNGLSIRDSNGDIILDAGNKTIDTTLSISPVTGAGFRAGNLTWDASGNRTNGTGVALTPAGILAHNGTKTTFAIDNNTGTAKFAGDLEAARGTFAGDLSAATGNFSGNLVGANITGATGNFTGTLTAGTLDISQLVGTTLRYTSPGVYYPTCPAGFTQMRVTLVGGGGGGRGVTADLNGAGGGGGGLTIATFNINPGTTVAVVVGGGGGPANSGGTTYVQNYAQATGGQGAVSIFTAGAGGIGTINGRAGTASTLFTNYIGEGGFESGGSPGVGGNSGSNYGVGGGKNVNGGLYGGGGGMGPTTGGSGLAIIEFFNPNGVIIRSEWSTLIGALQRQGISTT